MIDFKKKLEEEERQAGREPAAAEEVELDPGVKKGKRFITYIIAVIAIAIIFAGRVLISSQNATNWLAGGEMLINGLRHLVPSADSQLQGEDADRVNIMLLGIGGEGHDGPWLTDTMMLASLKPSTSQLSLISIPRDLVTPINGWQKINSIDAYAEQKQPGSGGPATAAAMGQLLQIPVQYYVRLDFNGFARIIDELGGITVNVENTLDDYQYPIDGQEDNPNYYARFEHLHIDKGPQTMDGALALKYVRSRHAYGVEGSDFARARRQQLVLEAIKDKLLSAQILLNPVTVSKLVNEFSQDISANLNVWEMLRLWDLVKNIDQKTIINKVLSNAPDGFLVAGTGEDGAYILTPSSGNFADIRSLVQNIFTVGAPAPDIIPAAINGQANVLVLNGTWVTGLAGKTGVFLTQYKFNILSTGNAPDRNYAQTTVYDLTLGAKPDSLAVLEKAAGAHQSFQLPAWLNNYKTATSSPDFILIMGADANQAE